MSRNQIKLFESRVFASHHQTSMHALPQQSVLTQVDNNRVSNQVGITSAKDEAGQVPRSALSTS